MLTLAEKTKEECDRKLLDAEENTEKLKNNDGNS